MFAGALLKALGYIRCSTAEQAIEGISLDAQRSRIASWCEATGAVLVEVIEDAGVSGTRTLADRPGGAHIASLLAERNPMVETVVVARLDRLGRDAAETLTCLRQFAKGTVGLVSVADRIDLGTATGRAMAQMSAVFAELERALIAQRTADALGELRSRGQVFGPVPYGFTRDGEHLVVYDAEQRVLARIRRLRSRGRSYAAIARSLNRSDTPAKRGGIWYPMSVRSVLHTAPKVGRPTEAAA
jgi:DNA invertase Pin-like site-specific DNA recombinase